eukprot:766061-Hanusia_phi.AAC.8
MSCPPCRPPSRPPSLLPRSASSAPPRSPSVPPSVRKSCPCGRLPSPAAFHQLLGGCRRFRTLPGLRPSGRRSCLHCPSPGRLEGRRAR